jgi:hypothetical protein
MKRTSLFAACLLFTACGVGQGDPFRAGFPSADTVKLEVPENARVQQNLDGTGVQRQELQGQTSDFYRLTRGVTVGVNFGVGAVLGLVKGITDHPATSLSGSTAVWGPHTGDLSPITWKFTVTRNGPQDFDYKLEGKAKQDADSAYVTVLSGNHQPALDPTGNPIEKLGEGSFLLDWDARQTLPADEPADKNVGKAEIAYSRLDPNANVTIDVVFTQVRDEATGGKVDATYKYVKKPGNGGEFEFMTNKDVQDNGSQAEHLTIKSRWQTGGAGRADVKATGGDLVTDADASECWDANFDSQYLAASWAPFHGWGAETACVFPTAEYSSL